MNSIFNNPVFRREALTTFRQKRTYIVMGIYVILMWLFAFLAVHLSISSSFFNPRDGKEIYNGMYLGSLLLMFCIVPALSATKINGERERQTLDLMLITKMSYLTIIIGNLLSSIMFGVVAIIAAIPVFALFLYFGVLPLNVLFLQIFLILLYSCMAGSIAILCSVVIRKPTVSIGLSSFINVVILFGTYIFVGVVNSILQRRFMDFLAENRLGFVEYTLPVVWQNVFTFVLSVNPINTFLLSVSGDTSVFTGYYSFNSSIAYSAIVAVVVILICTVLSSRLLKVVYR